MDRKSEIVVERDVGGRKRCEFLLALNLLFAKYHILYIIAEAERKLIPTIKEVLTHRITAYLKFRHV